MSGVRRVAAQDHERAERDRDEREHEPAPAAWRGRLGQIPDRRRDRHHAHAPGGERDDEQGQESTDRERDEEAPPADEVLDLKTGVLVLGAESGRHREHHAVRDGRAEQSTNRGGDEVVRSALEREHLDEVAAARSDGSCDPELATPLGGEHDEDQEDQQDAGGDRESTEGREDAS